MSRRGLNSSPGLHFGAGFGAPEISASAGEPQSGKAGVLEPPSDCFTVLHCTTDLCSLVLGIRSSAVHHCAKLLPFKYSSVLLSCTLLQGIITPSAEPLPLESCQQDSLCLVVPPALWPRLIGRDKISQHKFKFFDVERSESLLWQLFYMTWTQPLGGVAEEQSVVWWHCPFSPQTVLLVWWAGKEDQVHCSSVCRLRHEFGAETSDRWGRLSNKIWYGCFLGLFGGAISQAGIHLYEYQTAFSLLFDGF